MYRIDNNFAIENSSTDLFLFTTRKRVVLVTECSLIKVCNRIIGWRH